MPPMQIQFLHKHPLGETNSLSQICLELEQVVFVYGKNVDMSTYASDGYYAFMDEFQQVVE